MKVHAPACPRCGYDLSGLASSWQDSCPLHGQCSECGLGLRWAEVLNPILTVPRWSFEHAVRGHTAGRLIPTLARALCPPLFWRFLRLEHPVAPRRLLVLLLLIVLAVHAAVVAGTIWVVAASPWNVWFGRSIPISQALASSRWPYALGDSQSLVRGDVLEFDPSHVVGYPHWFVLAWFALTPLAFLVLADTFRLVRVRYIHILRAFVYSLTLVPVVMILHLAALALMATSGLGPWDSLTPDLRGLVRSLPLLSLAGGIAWLCWFWWVVPRDYLRLPHAAGVSIAMLTLSGTAAAVLMVLCALADMTL